jgi:hypothetical protein
MQVGPYVGPYEVLPTWMPLPWELPSSGEFVLNTNSVERKGY